MEELNEQQDTSASVDTQLVAETAPEPVVDVAPSIEAEGDGTEIHQDKPVAPAYEPNFKYKANREEKEFDDFLRGAITSKEAEDRIREIYEKANGLDGLKPRYEQERQEKQQVSQQFQAYAQQVQQITSHLQRDDLDSFFEAIKYPPQKVAEWLLKKMEIESLPPDQRAAYNERDRLKREHYTKDQQIQELTSVQMEGAIQARTSQLQGELAKPEIKSLIEEFDGRHETPDAFFNFVCERADTVFRRTGKDLTAAEAVQDAIKFLGLQSPAPRQGATPAGTVPAQKVITQPKPTVLPNPGTSSASATGKKPKSLAELRRMGAELAG